MEVGALEWGISCLSIKIHLVILGWYLRTQELTVCVLGRKSSSMR